MAIDDDKKTDDDDNDKEGKKRKKDESNVVSNVLTGAAIVGTAIGMTYALAKRAKLQKRLDEIHRLAMRLKELYHRVAGDVQTIFFRLVLLWCVDNKKYLHFQIK